MLIKAYIIFRAIYQQQQKKMKGEKLKSNRALRRVVCKEAVEPDE
jgi:hypothetical protein